MNEIILRTRPWFIPILAFLAVALFTLAAMYSYEANEQRYLESKSRQAARSIGQNLQDEIQDRISLLKVLGSNFSVRGMREFEDIAQSVVKEYNGCCAINLIDNTGVISKVYPYEPNRLALGKNLLERDDVRRYLEDSRDSKTPMMSHKLLTYQHVEGFTLYVPLFAVDGQFLGWLNGVVDYDKWLVNYLDSNDFQNVRIIVKWEHPNSTVVDRGHRNVSVFYKHTRRILNQTISFEVGFAPDAISDARNKSYLVIVTMGAILLLMAFVLIIMLTISQSRLYKVNDSLSTKNSLLTSLSHDLSTPVAVLNMALEPFLTEGRELTERQKKGVSNSLQMISDMLHTAKIFHAQDMGVFRPVKTAIPLAASLNTAVSLVASRALDKDVRIKMDIPSDDVVVLADTSTLISNVLLNVLSNAIKFSPTGGEVTIIVSTLRKHILLCIEDEGRGLSKEQLDELHTSFKIKSTPGTKGETGTGLGLLQVRRFMKSYGGSLKIENAPKGGCRVTLIFKNGNS